MKEIKLTKGYVALVDDEDYKYLSQWKWVARKAKSKRTVYAVRTIKRRGRVYGILMHRIVHGLALDRKLKIDHIDHNGLNNQKSNLCFATNKQNTYNSQSHKDSTSTYKGVCLFKRTGKWHAQINKDGYRHHLGYFDSPEEAAKVYNQMAVKLFGEFANLNIIP